MKLTRSPVKLLFKPYDSQVDNHVVGVQTHSL